jgi:hypothetical protein
MIIELLLAIDCMFLDGSDHGKERPFTLEGYLKDREAQNAEAAYGDDMWRMGWRG